MHPLYVVTPPGLEVACAQELLALGVAPAQPPTVGTGGVACSGSVEDVVGLNLMLRSASRILLLLGEGPIAALPGALKEVELWAYLPEEVRYAVEVKGAGKTPSRYVQAVRREVERQRPRAIHVAGGGEQTFHVLIRRGRFTLSLDASGEHLHRRGYREETGAAPLRENLAAGILLLSGWKGETPLLDPFCGSGTFLIEGALMALGRGPGARRSFACEGWPLLPASRVEAIRSELGERERDTPPAPIVGRDLKAGALGVSRRNARRAGVLPSLTLERGDATALEPPIGQAGLVVANPPYGRRVGERSALAPLYRGFGAALRERFAGWRVAVLLMDPALGDLLDLPAPEVLPLRNGGLPCRLLLATMP